MPPQSLKLTYYPWIQRITEDAYHGPENSLDTLGLKEADSLR